MNKYFFKMKRKVLLSDILNDLNISNHTFLNINSNFDKNILKYQIDDFVSFSSLKPNSISFFENKKIILRLLILECVLLKRQI